MQQEENVLGINGVPAGIESIYNCMFFKYYFLFSLLGTIMDTIRR